MKKAISLGLAILLAVVPLSGCRKEVASGGDTYSEYETYYYEDVEGNPVDGSGETASNGGSAANGNQNNSNGGNKITSDTTTAEDYNKTDITGIPSSLKNANITLASFYDPGSSDNTTAFYWAVQKYQELYGKNTVKLITTASETGYKEKIIAMMAGGDTPELLEMKTQWMPTWAIENMVQPVDGLIDYGKLHYQGLISAMTYKGKHYVACPNGMWSTMLWYNKSLFSKYGVKSPMDYYKGEGWTWDAFKKAAKDIKEASGGSVAGFAADCLDMLLRSQKNGLVLQNADGTYTNHMHSAEVAKAMQVMSEMIYTDKSWNPDLTAARTKFAKSKIAMSAGVIGFYQNYCKGLEYKDIEVVPLPKPTAADDYYCSAYGIFWAMGAGCKNSEGAVAFMKILAQYEDTDFGNRTPLERVLTDEQLALTRGISEKAGIMVHASLAWDPYHFWEDFTTKNIPAATVIDTYYNEVDAAIAKINK